MTHNIRGGSRSSPCREVVGGTGVEPVWGCRGGSLAPAAPQLLGHGWKRLRSTGPQLCLRWEVVCAGSWDVPGSGLSHLFPKCCRRDGGEAAMGSLQRERGETLTGRWLCRN